MTPAPKPRPGAEGHQGDHTTSSHTIGRRAADDDIDEDVDWEDLDDCPEGECPFDSADYSDEPPDGDED